MNLKRRIPGFPLASDLGHNSAHNKTMKLFWSSHDPAMSPNLSQIAAAQGVIPLEDVRTLGGLLADDEVEDFISVIYESRQRNGRSVSAPPIAAQRIIGE